MQVKTAHKRKLWKYIDGEPFLVNPHIVTLNPKKVSKNHSKKRGKKMARRRRDSKGRFISSRRRVARRRRRRNPVALANPRRTYRRRRRTYRRNAYLANAPRRRRRTYRRNPALFGRNRILGMSMTEIAYTGLGFIAPPAVEGFISGMLPAQLTGNVLGRYAVKTGIVAGVSFAGRQFIGREAGKFMAIGGVTYLVANLIVDYMPQLFAGFSGYMTPGRTLGMRSQPGLGRYIRDLPVSHSSGGTIPERLDSRARF